MTLKHNHLTSLGLKALIHTGHSVLDYYTCYRHLLKACSFYSDCSAVKHFVYIVLSYCPVQALVWGCKNWASSVSWPEFIKLKPYQYQTRTYFVLLARAGFLAFLFCVSGVCSVVFHCFWLSVPVQLIAWKDSCPKWPFMCRVGR